MFLKRNIIHVAYAARHTLYRTRLTEHVHDNKLNSIQTQEKQTEYVKAKLQDLLSKLRSIYLK